MTLNSENYIERINAFTQQDWKPLLDLIPEIERTKEFGEYHGRKKSKKVNTLSLYGLMGR